MATSVRTLRGFRDCLPSEMIDKDATLARAKARDAFSELAELEVDAAMRSAREATRACNDVSKWEDDRRRRSKWLVMGEIWGNVINRIEEVRRGLSEGMVDDQDST